MQKVSTTAIISLGSLILIVAATSYVWLHYTWLFVTHYNLKLAAPPLGEEGQKISGSFIREIGAKYRIIRLVPTRVAELSESMQALMANRADLAVGRSDNEDALKARTLFLFRKVAIAVLVPPKSDVETISDLRGKRIAVVGPTP